MELVQTGAFYWVTVNSRTGGHADNLARVSIHCYHEFIFLGCLPCLPPR